MHAHQESKFIIQNMSKNISSFISLQGSIGAGKSTILDAIKKYLVKNEMSIDFLPSVNTPEFKNKDYFLVINEPSQEWSKELYSTGKFQEILQSSQIAAPTHTSSVNSFGCVPENASDSCSSEVNSSEMNSSGMNTPLKKTSLLSLFYEDMERNGLMFQIHAFTTRLELIINQLNTIKEHNPDVRIHIICERSLRTDKLFFYNLYKSGVVRNVEWEVYNRFHTLICEEVMKMENIMLYVKTNPKNCLSRIKKRNRESEMMKNDEDPCAIPLEYLEKLEEEHNLMISEFQKIKGNSVLDVNFDNDMDMEQINLVVNDLMSNVLILV